MYCSRQSNCTIRGGSTFLASIRNQPENTGVFRNEDEETKHSADVHRSALCSFFITLLSMSVTARFGTRLVLQIVVNFHSIILRCSVYNYAEKQKVWYFDWRREVWIEREFGCKWCLDKMQFSIRCNCFLEVKLHHAESWCALWTVPILTRFLSHCAAVFSWMLIIMPIRPSRHF